MSPAVSGDLYGAENRLEYMLLPSHAGRIYFGSRFVCLCVSGKGTGVPATSFPQFALGSCGLEGARGLQIPLWDLFSLALAAFCQRRSRGEGLLPRWLCAWVSGSFSDCKVNGEANETKEQVWDDERTSHILSHSSHTVSERDRRPRILR